MPDAFPLYDGVTLGALRSFLKWKGTAGIRADVDFSAAEKVKRYIPQVQGDAESLLADKYHQFSAAELIIALRLHTDALWLFWPPEIGWADTSGPEILFKHGANSALTLSTVERLAIPTTFSAVATKTTATTVFRSRSGLLPIEMGADPHA